MTSAAVQLGEGGRLEVVRQAPPEDPVRLAATIERLRRAAGSGVIEVLDVREDETGARTLVLAHAGAAVAGPLAGADVARLGASVAAALADLHERGMTHGAVRAEHVMRDAAGTVRLCGLGHGEGAPSDDVAALAGLLRSLLIARDTTDAARAVRVVADRCEVVDPAARPSASAVAASLASATPAARTTTRASVTATVAIHDERDKRRARLEPSIIRLPRSTIVIAVATVIAALAMIVFVSRPSSARATPSSHPTTTITTIRATPSTTTRATTAQARRVWPPPPPHVVHANGTWTFGTEDDRVALGDWDCDGVDTPALVQADGDVYVVDSWTDGARGRRVATIADVLYMRVERSPTCDGLVLMTADGHTVRPTLDGS